MPQAVVTVTGKDKPGIIAKVTGALFEESANLEDISMTILEGEFAMIMIASLADASTEKAVRKKLKHLQTAWGLTVTWSHPRRRLQKGRKHARNTQTYILTAAGRDRTGIVYKISRLFAKRRFNITDLNSKILPAGPGGLYVLILEADLPRAVARKSLERDLEALRQELEIDIQMRPVEEAEF